MRRAVIEAMALSEQAAGEVLGAAGLEPEDIGLFATMTTTTHAMPGLERVAGLVGMSDTVERLNLGPMGCYAAVPGLAACRSWVEHRQRPALLVVADVFSPHRAPQCGQCCCAGRRRSRSHSLTHRTARISQPERRAISAALRGGASVPRRGHELLGGDARVTPRESVSAARRPKAARSGSVSNGYGVGALQTNVPQLVR